MISTVHHIAVTMPGSIITVCEGYPAIIKTLFNEYRKQILGVYDPTSLEIYTARLDCVYENGSRIQFRCFDKVDNVRGAHRAVLYIPEKNTIEREILWNLEQRSAIVIKDKFPMEQ